MSQSLLELVNDARGCTACSEELPFAPRPIFQVSESATLLIAGQAPGIRAHNTQIPFNDPSGDRLRDWLGLDRSLFYDAQKVVLLPMAFCYPGSAERGDLPPPKRCAELWRTKFLESLPNIKLTVACGIHAVNWYRSSSSTETLTETVKNWRNAPVDYMPLPHPSPRNNGWLKTNRWFNIEVLPELKKRVKESLNL